MSATYLGPLVVSMRGRKGIVPDGAVYVGRSMRFYGLPVGASPFANPYSGRRYSDYALVLFAEMLRSNPDLVAEVRRELRGKVLACWCGEFFDVEPVRCHAQILVRIAAGGEP